MVDMKRNRFIPKIFLAGALAFGAAGCGNDHPEYVFDGYVDGEHLRFYNENISTSHYLEVKKKDGTVLKFEVYYNDDLEFEWFDITIDGKTTQYKRDSSSRLIRKKVHEAQVIFDQYLDKIEKIKLIPFDYKTVPPELPVKEGNK